MYRLELWILTKKCPVSSGSFSSSAALPLEADGASSRRCRSCMWKKKALTSQELLDITSVGRSLPGTMAGIFFAKFRDSRRMEQLGLLFF